MSDISNIEHNLSKYWDRKVSALVNLQHIPIVEEQKERHRLYGLLLMAIVHNYWNGMKEGRKGSYPLNPSSSLGTYMDNDYLGHNIASLVVDRNGSIIDFDFNHNKIFGSSAEHAEMRVVKRIYSLTRINDTWQIGNKDSKDYQTFEDCTLYTSLESCSQCSGVMTLARVKEVVYLQPDPTQYRIGNILRNLTAGTPLSAPYPIPASIIDFNYYIKLEQAFKEFSDASPVFFIPRDGENKKTKSITSFLCTNVAYKIYSEATAEFMNIIENKDSLKYGNYQPNDNVKTNNEIVCEIKDFYYYVIKSGNRGTPHT